MQCVNIPLNNVIFFHNAMKIPHLEGLPPCIRFDCRILILGSMPSAASLRADFYYAHPQNRFWPVMGRILGFDPGLAPSVRIERLLARHIGLWDVIGRCRRHGSLDTAIESRSIVVNPIAPLLPRLEQLERILCNGAVAYQAWTQKVAPTLLSDHLVRRLPSTSPANAAWSKEALVTEWHRAIAPSL